MTYQIEKMLVLSTGHVREETGKLLDGDRKDLRDGWEPWFRDDYGWVWHTGQDLTGDVPDELKDVLAFAKQLGCQWLKLDCDGPFVDELERWEW